MAWENPVTTWGQAGKTVPGAGDFNRIEGNTQYLKDEVDSHKAENASTTAKGHVQLSSSTSSTSTSLAATASAVKTVKDEAKAYTDAHEQKTAPHSGHETPAGAQAKAEAAAGAVQAELNTHKAEKANLSVLGHVNHAVLTATLDTTWSGTSAPYTKTVSVSGILSTDTPIIDVVMSGTYSTDEARTEAWGYIYRAVTANGSITFYATEKPTVSLPIQIRVVR